MPTVGVSSLITGLNPIRQTSTYSMPVLSPRHSSSTTLTGSYRSTFSSSSISRPYYGTSSYSSPRINTYSERYTSKTYSTDSDKKIYSRHSSISEDTREKSLRRDSLTRDSRELSLTRSETSSSRNNISTLNMIESVADLRNKYSPANYVPAVLRKSDNISRSKSINDIGRPPLEKLKQKKVIENGVCNGVNTNLTNKLDIDNNGNRASVAEIRKKFDPNYKKLVIEGTSISPKDNNITEPKIKETSELLVGGNKLYSRPAKFFKINDIDVQEKSESENADSSMDVTDSRPHHTTNFASYISTKDYSEENDGKEDSAQNEEEMDNSENVTQCVQNKIVSANNVRKSCVQRIFLLPKSK